MATEATAITAADHIGIAWDLLAESDRHFADRKHLPASEMLWQVTVHAILAVALHRGWPCDGSRQSLRTVVERLYEEERDDLISLKYIYAENFRDNAETDFMEFRALAYDGARSRDYIRCLLAMV
jgi:hypothetical protein